MGEIGFEAFDCDNHYYEATDAFTRHLDPAMAARCMQWADVDGRPRLLVGGQICRFVPHPRFEMVSKPGCLDQYFRGNASSDDIREAMGDLEPIRPEYRDRDARLELMDRQGLEAAFLIPTLGVGMEEALAEDPEACVTAFWAFNRWLEEDWGFAYRERIFALPYLPLIDPDAAAEMVDWVVDHDARAIVLRAGPVALPEGGRASPGLPHFDPFWARVADAGITVAIHSGDSGYGRYVADWEPTASMEAYRQNAFRSMFMSDKPVFDTMAALVCHGVFLRHPGLRVATIETGASYVPELLRKLGKYWSQNPGFFEHQDPRETFRRHVWVSPYFEDDIPALVSQVGADHVLFGSDYPHPEGLADPVSYVDELDGLGEEAIRRIMRDNAFGLVTRDGSG